MVIIGCINKESFSALFLKNLTYWIIQDPKGKSINEVRKTRDQIEAKIIELVKSHQRQS